MVLESGRPYDILNIEGIEVVGAYHVYFNSDGSTSAFATAPLLCNVSDSLWPFC